MNEQKNPKLLDGFVSRIKHENINLEFNFAHSGVSKIRKKNNLILSKANKIKSRTFTTMNLIKKILGK
jgi:hypothetical protein